MLWDRGAQLSKLKKYTAGTDIWSEPTPPLDACGTLADFRSMFPWLWRMMACYTDV